MKRLVAIGFILVLAMAVLVYLVLDPGPRPSSLSPASGASPVADAKIAATGETAEKDALEEEAGELSAIEEGTARRTAAPTPAEHAGPWLEGRVDLDRACQADPTLEVFALSEPTTYTSLARRLDAPDSGAWPSGPWPELIARVSVQEDGSFRLPIPEEMEAVHVALRGRFLFTGASVDAGSRPWRPVVIVPERGAAVRVRLETRDGLDPGKVDLRLDQTVASNSFGDGDDEDSPRFSARATDEAFEFRALPVGGHWSLTAMPEHHAAQKVTIAPLEACEERTVDLALERGGTLAGRVLDESDEPVAGATVKALWQGRFFGFDDPELRDAKTDADGAFRIEALPPGEVSLQASREGLLTSVKEKADVPAEGAREGIVLRLSLGGVIAGSVTWPDGRPAGDLKVNVDVDLAEISGTGFLGLQRGSKAKATTDEEGRFRATGLGKGPFIVECSSERDEVEVAEAGASESAEDEIVDSDSVAAPRHRARARAVHPGTEDLLLVLQPPVGLWGRAVDPEGTAVTEFEAELHEVTGGMLASFTGTRREQEFTSEQGSFFFGDVPQGRWEVAIRSATHSTLEPVVVEMPATSEADPLVVTLVPTAVVTGTVRAPDGEPVVGAAVMATRSGGGMEELIASRVRQDEAPKSDDEGRFRLEGLLPGSVSLHAEAEGWARGPALALDLVGGATIADVELGLLVGGTLTGEVYDDDGEPASGHMVTAQLMPDFQQRMVTTDAAGTFRIEHLAPGNWQVSAMDSSMDWMGDGESFDPAKMFESLELAQVTIQDGLESHVVLGGAPKDPIRVHGRVTHMDEPYRGAMLTFYATGERPFDSMNFTSVDDRGEYEITLEGAGTYIVSVARITGEVGQQNTIEFPTGIPAVAEHRLDFRIPHGRISGHVYGPGGDGVSGARITLSPDGVIRSDSLFGGQYTEIQTDGEGRYDVQGLRAGKYRVSAGGAAIMGFRGDPTTGRLTRGGLALAEEQWLQDVDFRLEAPGTLEVFVRDSAGAVAGGATIFVRDSDGRICEAMSFRQTDSGGRCVYSGLAPGRYTALARSGGDASAESESVEVRTGESSRVELSLEPGAILWVRFRLDDGGDVPAHVQITDSAGRDVTALLGIADIQALYQEGSFSPTEHRIGPLHPGKYKVHAWTDDGKSAKKNVVVEAGEREQRFTLKLGSE